MEAERRIFDPRAGLWLLIAANMIAFRPHAFWLELALIGLLLVLMLGHGRLTMMFKWAVGYCALVVFQQFILERDLSRVFSAKHSTNSKRELTD